MYVNPFWAGVAATILAEFALLVIVAIIRKRKSKQVSKKVAAAVEKSWRDFLEEHKR